MKTKNKKVQRLKRTAIATTQLVKAEPKPGDLMQAADISEPQLGPQMLKWLAETFGTQDRALQDRLLSQATGAVSDFPGRELTTFDYIAAAMHGMAPRDSLEGMLGTQIVAGHTLAMTLLERAALPNQADLIVEVNVNRAVKLMRVMVEQIAALGRHRGKGEQKMTVEHVHVHQGGQAIVGPVTANLPDK